MEFLIKYKFEQILNIDEFCYPNVDELFGEIFSVNGNNNEHQTKIGEIHMDLYYCDTHHDLITAFDRSGVAFEIGNLIIDFNRNELIKEIEDLIRENENPNILVINQLTLFSSFRNKGYGKKILKGIEDVYIGKAGIIILKSFPRQHEIRLKGSKEYSELKFNSLEQNIERAQKSLNKFYEDCGYKNLPEVDNFYFKEIPL